MARTRRCDTPRAAHPAKAQDRATPEYDCSIRRRASSTDLTTIVSQAAAAILAVRASALDPRTKADQSPVTAADDASEAIILEGVARLLPGVPVISEEAQRRRAVRRSSPTTSSWSIRSTAPANWSPAATNSPSIWRFVRAGRPALGIVAAPALGLVWRTASRRRRRAAAAGARRAGERGGRGHRDPDPPDAERPASSRRSAAPISMPQPRHSWRRLPALARSRGSSGSAIKFCRVAEGAADVYPRLAPTYQWDVAAGHAVAGGRRRHVTTPGAERRCPIAQRRRPPRPGLHRLGRPVGGHPGRTVM